MEFTVTIPDDQLDKLAQKVLDKMFDRAPALEFGQTPGDESGDDAPASSSQPSTAAAIAQPSTAVSSIPSTAPSTSPQAADPAAEYRAKLASLQAEYPGHADVAAVQYAQAAPAPAAPVAQDAGGANANQGADLTPERIAQMAADQFAAERQGLDADQAPAATGPAVFDAQYGRFVQASELAHPDQAAAPAPTQDEYTAP